MSNLKCKVKIIEDGQLPSKSDERDACYDLKVRTIEEVNGNLFKVTLGVALQPQQGYRVAIYPRSSISKTGWVLANSVGVGDNNYTGEYCAYFIRVNSTFDWMHTPDISECVWSGKKFPYEVGDRCCQMELVPYHQIDFETVDELEETDRGRGGFGSTGK